MSRPFFAKVYTIVAQIPPGKVATYQDIARLVGSPKASRAVGSAMKNNPDMKTVPCHRVVGSDGSMLGYAFGDGIISKQALLLQEGVVFTGNKVDLHISRWEKATS